RPRRADRRAALGHHAGVGRRCAGLRLRRSHARLRRFARRHAAALGATVPPEGGRRMTRTLFAIGLALGCLGAASANADPTMGMGPPRGPTFLRELFMPSAVMRYQTEIGLTDAQRTTITNDITEAQKRVVDLRWQLEAKDAAFGKLLGADKIDEQAAMAQAA